jgi:TATA-box binding protein (TBP) (component of TFIID and TFIIIB)
MASDLNVSTMVSMLTTDLRLSPDKLEPMFNQIFPIDYDTTEEGIIKLNFRGMNKGFCKKTMYQKTPKIKSLKKTFVNQISAYIRVFDKRKAKIVDKTVLNNGKFVYEFKKGQTAFQYKNIYVTFKNTYTLGDTLVDTLGTSNEKNNIDNIDKINTGLRVLSVVNRKSIPNTILIDTTDITEKNFEICVNKIGYSNSILIESTKEIQDIYIDFIVEVNCFVFTSGKIKTAGCTDNSQITKAMSHLNKTFAQFDEAFRITSMESVMINSDYKNNFEIKRFELDHLIREKYKLISSYEPCTHPAVIIKYYCNFSYDDISGRCLCREKYARVKFCHGKGDCTESGGCKSVTILVFQSGKVIITGGRNLNQVHLAYNFIKNLVQENKSLIERI